MSSPIRWLRISYWTGAIVDALAAVQLLVPALFAATNGLPGFRPDVGARYAMGTAAALMSGWTVLLLWADRRPLERKGVLLITIVPVVAGVAINEIWAVRRGFLPWRTTTPIWILQALLSTLFLYSYLRAARK